LLEKNFLILRAMVNTSPPEPRSPARPPEPRNDAHSAQQKLQPTTIRRTMRSYPGARSTAQATSSGIAAEMEPEMKRPYEAPVLIRLGIIRRRPTRPDRKTGRTGNR